jgi:hypothetical protein
MIIWMYYLLTFPATKIIPGLKLITSCVAAQILDLENLVSPTYNTFMHNVIN